MTDWTTARVVRDGKGRLRTDDGPIRGLVGDGLVSAESAAAYEHMLGPLTPVLDANGLPVVTTVGDLTARHIGKRVRVNGTVRNIISVAHTRDGSTVLHLQPGSRSDVCLETASVAPCEVLDD